MLTPDERIYSLKRQLKEIRSSGRANSLETLVTVEAGQLITLIDDLLNLIENEIFTESELYTIWNALQESKYLVAADELADRVHEMVKRRHV
jgi:hypothetical protein